MTIMNGHEVIAQMKAAGWKLDRIAGSHHVLVKDGRAIPVPVHGKQDLGDGLLSAIQRQAGIKLK
ncbi:MAG: type II toxin-antitoxin system HicA family toxin [Magnetococcus sp. DMHC-8]